MTRNETIRRNAKQARDHSAKLLSECGELKASCRKSQLTVAKTLARVDEQLLKDFKLEDRLAKGEPDD